MLLATNPDFDSLREARALHPDIVDDSGEGWASLLYSSSYPSEKKYVAHYDQNIFSSTTSSANGTKKDAAALTTSSLRKARSLQPGMFDDSGDNWASLLYSTEMEHTIVYDHSSFSSATSNSDAIEEEEEEEATTSSSASYEESVHAPTREDSVVLPQPNLIHELLIDSYDAYEPLKIGGEIWCKDSWYFVTISKPPVPCSSFENSSVISDITFDDRPRSRRRKKGRKPKSMRSSTAVPNVTLKTSRAHEVVQKPKSSPNLNSEISDVTFEPSKEECLLLQKPRSLPNLYDEDEVQKPKSLPNLSWPNCDFSGMKFDDRPSREELTSLRRRKSLPKFSWPEGGGYCEVSYDNRRPSREEMISNLKQQSSPNLSWLNCEVSNKVFDDRPRRGELSSARKPKSLPNLFSSSYLKTKRKPRKFVRFGTIQVRQYERVLEINPSTSAGPSIGLGWAYDRAQVFPIPTVSTPKKLTRLSREERTSLLKDLGWKQSEIAQAVRRARSAPERQMSIVKPMRMVKRFMF